MNSTHQKALQDDRRGIEMINLESEGTLARRTITVLGPKYLANRRATRRETPENYLRMSQVIRVHGNEPRHLVNRWTRHARSTKGVVT